MEDYEWAIRGDFASHTNYENETLRIMEMAHKIAVLHGVEVQQEILVTDKGPLSKYPALRILPSKTSAANKEALKVQQENHGVKLYLSPYDLKRSKSEAFFSLEKGIIGVPFDFIYNRIESEPYQHEKVHMETYRQLLLGKDDQMAGVVRLLNGRQVTRNSFNGYIRFFSIDESKATMKSLELNIQALYALYKSMDLGTFQKNVESNQLANRIHFQLELARGLALQQQDVNERALKNLEQGRYKLTKELLNFGDQLKSEVHTFTTLIDSYDSELSSESRRFEIVARPEGTEIKFYSLSDDPELLKVRMKVLMTQAQNDLPKIEKALTKILKPIELVDLSRSDIKGLYDTFEFYKFKNGLSCKAMLKNLLGSIQFGF